jgi:hypothetical protein
VRIHHPDGGLIVQQVLRFNFITGRCEAQPTCPSGDPPNSQGQCTTTTVVGLARCPDTPLPFEIIQTSSGYVCGIVASSFDPNCASRPGASLDGIDVGSGRNVCVSDSQPSPCPSGQFNPSTRMCEVTTTTSATCPQGTALSGNVCAGHPIPRGPKPT